MTIGNIIAKLETANRLLTEGKVENNKVLVRIWRDEIEELHGMLADLGIIVEYPHTEEIH